MVAYEGTYVQVSNASFTPEYDCCQLATMRVDLSPQLGGHTVANQPPHYCPPLIHLHPPRGTV